MASNLTVKVHPAVSMAIVDSFMRSGINEKSPGGNKVLGTLLGYYEKSVIQITNCFAIPFSESAHCVELDINFNVEMISQMSRAVPAEKPVGWFYTTHCLSSNSIILHEYYSRIVKSSWVPGNAPCVFLTVDTSLTGPGNEKYRIPMRAFVRSYAGIPGNPEPHCIFFNRLPVEMDTSPGERVALQVLQNTLSNKKRETHLEGDVDHLNRTIAQMIDWLKYVLKYVKTNIKEMKDGAGEKKFNDDMGRHLMELANTLTARLPKTKLDVLVENSVRDYSVIRYLADFLHSQLNVYEKYYCE